MTRRMTHGIRLVPARRDVAFAESGKTISQTSAETGLADAASRTSLEPVS
jgi:hypothetical protein